MLTASFCVVVRVGIERLQPGSVTGVSQRQSTLPTSSGLQGRIVIEWLRERTEHLDIFLPPITQWCSISDVQFTGGRGVSDFSVLKYY